jgi:hypothetical protein
MKIKKNDFSTLVLQTVGNCNSKISSPTAQPCGGRGKGVDLTCTVDLLNKNVS